MVEKQSYDLILLDIMLPKINGYVLMEYLSELEIPVIFITAKGSVQERVKGLRMGADDYLVKPFAIDELLARVDNVLRRYHKSMQEIHVLDVTIHTATRVVKKKGTVIPLTKKEFDLLSDFHVFHPLPIACPCRPNGRGTCAWARIPRACGRPWIP